MLKLPWQRGGRAILADGSVHLFDVYETAIQWDGQPVTVPVDEADTEPLIGMSLMRGYDLHVRNVDEGPVTLTKISDNKPEA